MSFVSPSSPRLVSLVPSQTELLFDLGLDEAVVGLTKFCVHPAGKIVGKTVVGGTKNVQVSRVAALQPTLILANYEENTEADVIALREIAPVHVTDVKTFSDALLMIREVGTLAGREAEADALVQKIEASFAALRPETSANLPTVAYLIWQNPWMVAARNTFIDAMLSEAGFRNAFAEQTRYPVVTEADIQRADPDLIFLSSEPYPFKDSHLAEWMVRCPNARVRLVDGELFSWYGSRLLCSAPYFARLRSDLRSE